MLGGKQKGRFVAEAPGQGVVESLVGFLGLLTGLQPARDACGEVFHVFVAKLFRSLRSGLIGIARRTATVSDHQGVFVVRQHRGARL